MDMLGGGRIPAPGRSRQSDPEHRTPHVIDGCRKGAPAKEARVVGDRQGACTPEARRILA